jgi:hypothetical protein
MVAHRMNFRWVLSFEEPIASGIISGGEVSEWFKVLLSKSSVGS